MTFFLVTHIVKLTLNYLHIQSPCSLLPPPPSSERVYIAGILAPDQFLFC